MNLSAVLSAFLFFISNLLIIIFKSIDKRRDFDRDLYTGLDPDYIQEQWDFRMDHRAKWFTASILNTCAWFFFCFPMVQFSFVMSRRGSTSLGLHVAIAILTVFGSFTECMSRLLYMGAEMSTKMMVQEFNLDNWISDNSDDKIGWRCLEVSHTIARGLILLVDSFEWIAIFVIMVLVHVSVRRWRMLEDHETFGAGWNGLGLFIGFLALLDFLAEVAQLDGFKVFHMIAFWYASLNRLVLLPLWLLMLGWKLPYAAMKLNETTVKDGSTTPI
eukprot:Nitzschia sp. Nitz4//scaffold45_size130396//101118//101936//NITZ4_003466-RA/size130396-processed-gene-0.199-mRNA-1//1//CDS//3329552449//7955//frame0